MLIKFAQKEKDTITELVKQIGILWIRIHEAPYMQDTNLDIHNFYDLVTKLSVLICEDLDNTSKEMVEGLSQSHRCP